MKHSDFWQGDRGILNIKPKRIGELWESYDAVQLVSDLVGDMTVVEVGCGQGRFSAAFKPEKYVGVDINEAAIEMSKKGNPNHIFEHIKEYSDIPQREAMLLHSVCLHIPDEEIGFLFERANKRIVLAETMGPRRERAGERPPDLAFHYARTAEDFVKLLQGWKLVQMITKPDTNSSKTFTYMVFDNA